MVVNTDCTLTSSSGLSRVSVLPRWLPRSRRVILILLGVVILSVADLIVTLAYLRSTGMAEANPIAVWLIRTTGSTTVLAGYKLLTVGICVSLLYRYRRFGIGEIASWCALAIMAGMCLLWHNYSRGIEIDTVHLVQAEMGDRWIMLD